MNNKHKVIKKHKTAIAVSPRPRGMYYDQWTVIIPPTAVGIFGPMSQILGHGLTAKKAWADAAQNIQPLKG